MQLKKFEEQIFFTTVRIRSVGPAGEASLGTGFLVQAKVTDNRRVILAVSNKHVLVDRRRHMILEFTKADSTQEEPRPLLGETLPVQGKAVSDLYYFEHPEPNVDLACLNVSIIGKSEACVYFRTLELTKMAATFEEEWLLPNQEVCFVGYPDGRFDTKNNLPILRRGVIASIPKVDFEGEKQFLIDAQVYQGSSGSPVFMTPGPFGGEVKFVGVLSAGMMKHEKLAKLPVNFERFGVKHTIGLGFVLKPALVTELVDTAVGRLKADLQKDEKPSVEPVAADHATAAPA